MFKNKSTRALIITMCALVILGITIAKIFYSNQNAYVDPRIELTRELYKKYNSYAQSGNFDSVFWLMDTIESIYTQFNHYKNSFEVGVLQNNKAASYLTLALHSENSINNTEVQDSLINLAEYSVKKGITIYEEWLTKFKNISENEIGSIIETDFFLGLENYNTELRTKFFNKRIEEIKESKTETKRRLSVSYTNLGVIHRHKLQYEMAAKNYKKALDLWDKNLTAENNLNILLGRPLKKRNLIQRMFPPERIEN